MQRLRAVRVNAGTNSRTLNQLLRHRDEQMPEDPSANGQPQASRDWFQATKLH
jgi:hypothetical protein